jgi:predicted AAA+ superfamily ATPase
LRDHGVRDDHALKEVVDEFGNKPPLLVTGSARLDAFRRTGDALTGRHYFYRLRPIDPAESKLFLPELTLDARINRLLSAGGFPEAYLNPKEAARLRNDRMELVTRDDLRDLSRVSSWRALRISWSCCASVWASPSTTTISLSR